MANEVRRVVASPEKEAACIQEYESWGWLLKQRQEIYDAHTKFDSAAVVYYGGITLGRIKQHDEVTNYVSMIFERNLSDPTIKELATLQTAIPELKKKEEEAKKTADKAKSHYEGQIAGAKSNVSHILHWKGCIIGGSITAFLGFASGLTCILLVPLARGSQDWYLGGANLLIFVFLPGLYFLISGIEGHARRDKLEEYKAKIGAAQNNRGIYTGKLGRYTAAQKEREKAEARVAEIREEIASRSIKKEA